MDIQRHRNHGIGLLLFVFSMMLVLASCGSTNRNQGSRFNKPVLYNPVSSSLHPKLGVFHVSDIASQLFVMLNTSELLVSEANQQRIPKSEVSIRYELYDCTEIENNKMVSDSATFVNSLEITQQQRILVFPITIAAEQGRRYMLLVQTTDLLRRNTIRQFLTVNKTDIYSAQNFRLTALNGSPKLENTITQDEIFRIAYQRKPVDKIFIKYMSAQQPVASSPLSPAPTQELTFKADSVWEQPYNPNANYMFGYNGLFLIQTDTTQRGGLLLMNFGVSYPREDRTEQLVQPIQYIASAAEYQRLSALGHPKQMMDNFWLSATGSTDRARMLIRVFYTRMSYANQFFTDFKEGWKTDRGMIYMVYGLPDNINKGSNSETWEYTRKQQATPLSFTFDLQSSPYSDDYFVLRRGDAAPTYWRQAVDSWRQGRVFTINDLD